MIYIKLFENFGEKLFSNNEIEELIIRYQSWTLKSYDESKYNIIKFLNTPFSFDFNGIKDFPEQIELYRLIHIEDELDESFLGHSWTFDKKLLYNKDFLKSIRIGDDIEYDLLNLKVIIGTFKKDQIDFYFTILNWFRNPKEKEISVLSNPMKWKIENYKSKLQL